MAIAAWIESKRLILKIQQGTGDNLSADDIANGYCFYVLWSTFRPEYLDMDEELPLELVDGGMLMFEKEPRPETYSSEVLSVSYEHAFTKPYDCNDCKLLWEDNT